MLKTLDEDSQIVSNMSFYNSNCKNSISNEERTNNIFKNIIINPSHIKNRNNKNKINYKIYNNSEINKSTLHEQDMDLDSNNNELNVKKKLFNNKICLIKDKNINNFNKSNSNNNYSLNHNTISCHTNFLNSNRTSINYIEDKEKLKNNANKTIYQNISFSKEQPFIIYHRKKPKPNFIINNNQNCPNLLNIVFLNQEENNKIKYYDSYNDKENDNMIMNISHPKIPNHKYNYRFHEIKSNSIDNYLDNKTNKYFYFSNNNATIMDRNNSSYKLTNIKDNIYSNKENYKINGNKYFEISNYGSSRNINKIKLNKNEKIRIKQCKKSFFTYSSKCFKRS